MMWVLLSLIMFFGSFFRVWGINQIPPELFGDEIDVGYQAYSLLTTGRDIYNQPLPTYIKSLSESRAPLIIYATVPTVALAGLNEWGVRLTPAVFGILGMLSLFLLAYAMTKSSMISVFSVVGLAFMPWHIQYSRAGFEVTLLFTLITLATTMFIKKKYVLAYFFFALCFYTYSTAVLFVPLLLVILWLSVKPRIFTWGLLLFVVLLIPFGFQTLVGQTGNRFGHISIATNPEIAANLTLYKSFGVPKIFSNRYVELGRLFITNYLDAFSPNFLFVRGDPNTRHNYQYTGELLPISLIFLVTGFIGIIGRRKWLLPAWLLLAPIPAALTFDGGNHATRLFLMTIPLSIAIGWGVFLIWQWSRYALMGLVLVWMFTFIQAGIYYTKVYPAVSWRWWEIGYKDILRSVSAHGANYNRIFINNTYEPALERFLFWTNYPPEKFHQLFTIDQPMDNIVTNYNGFSLDGKYFFGDFSKKEWTSTLLPNSLYLISQRDNVAGDWDWRKSPPGDIRVVSTTVNFKDEPIFYLITRK